MTGYTCIKRPESEYKKTMKIKQLDGGFGRLRKKNDVKPSQDEKGSSRATPSGSDHSAASPTPKSDEESLPRQGVAAGLNPVYVGNVEKQLVPILEGMGYEGDRLNVKNVNNIKGLFSEIMHAPRSDNMAEAFAYLAVLLRWHGIAPDPTKLNEPPKAPEPKPTERAYYRERLAICADCPEAFETLGRIRCAQCRCFMEVKAFLRASRCPLKKW